MGLNLSNWVTYMPRAAAWRFRTRPPHSANNPKETTMTQAQCVSECASSYYDANYFNWQKDIGAFGGWANAFKFKKSVKPGDTVIDFGCGGGFLLQNLNGGTKIGIEPNAAAVESVRRFGITHFASPREALD